MSSLVLVPTYLTKQQTYYGNAVGEVKEYDASCDHAVEGGVEIKMETAEYRDNDRAEDMSIDGDDELQMSP